MKFAIVFAAVFAVALAAPQHSDKDAKVVSQNAEISPDQRKYSYSVQTDNGISALAAGQLEETRSYETNEPAFGFRVQGEFSYVGDDGRTYNVKYVADENGFRPEVSDRNKLSLLPYSLNDKK